MQHGVSTISVEELCGVDFCGFVESADNFEKHWQWPEEMGKGFMSVFMLRPGLILGVGEYLLRETVSIRMGVAKPPFIIGFTIPTTIRFSVNNRRARMDSFIYNSGRSAIFYLPEWEAVAEYPPCMPIRSIGIFIDPSLLSTFFEHRQYNSIPAGVRDIIEGCRTKAYYHEITLTPQTRTILHQLLNCSYRSPLKRLYIESKVLELISHSFLGLISGPREPRSFVLHPDDMERIRAARDTLVHDMESPPALLDLARMVGINKNKLNLGFNQVFGTSVFDYLRIHRLERARELLETKAVSVTEAAFEVGYSHSRSFARAFKKHFGTNPKELIR
jgi:AraC family transcriptional activator of pyochelin receptor